MQVYPAAGLVYEAPDNASIYYIDPNADELFSNKNIHCIKAKAGIEVPNLVEELMDM
jgi:hypothetical protein